MLYETKYSFKSATKRAKIKMKINEKANFEIVMPKASLFLKLDLFYREAKSKTVGWN